MRVLGPISVVLGLSALIAGCPRNELKAVDLCPRSTVNKEITTNAIDKVDMLFMVDNSSSMLEEQARLAEQLPALATVLAKGELVRADGTVRTFPPVKSLHLGVVSSNMGTHGQTYPKLVDSSCKGLGDDGKLLHDGVNRTITVAGRSVNCAPNHEMWPTHLSFDAEAGDSPQQLGEDFACIATLDTGGCGFEQQLEAVLKALTPSDSSITFSGGSKGHGDTDNAGFLRDDSVIAIVLVSDEEDCSLPDASGGIFNPDENDPLDVRTGGVLLDPMGYYNSRCALHYNEDDGALFPVQRYIDGLRALRPTDPNLLVFAAIVGVPPDVDSETITVAGGVVQQDFDKLLADDRMQTRVVSDPSDPDYNGGLPVPVCEVLKPGGGIDVSASPARRITEVAKAFESNGVVRSICADDFSSALDSIVDKVADQLDGGCLDRGLVPTEDGLVPCDIVEISAGFENEADLPDCDATKGRALHPDEPVRTDENGRYRRVCKINQVAVDKSLPGCERSGEDRPNDCLKENPSPIDRVAQGIVGWYYDDFSEEKVQACRSETKVRIAFTVGAEQATGSKVQFECLQPVYSALGEPKGKEAINKPCDGTANAGMSIEEINGLEDECSPTSTEQLRLRCQPASNTCQALCSEANNCPDGWECYKPSGALGYCVNPTCPPE